MDTETKGTLYGLGVGPGDPKLLTLRALEVLQRVDVVFAAGSTKNSYSRALNVVQSHLNGHHQVRHLGFPMTSDQGELERAWEDNARQVLAVLDTGEDAAFVTIGDPLTYSTYGYLLRTVRRLAPDTKVETVPGVTAYHAAAAKLNMPLVESTESLVVVSGVSDPEDIPRLASFGDNLVIMKTYRNYDKILDALDKLPVPRKSFCVQSISLPEERVTEDAGRLRGEKMPYLSLVVVKGKREAS